MSYPDFSYAIQQEPIDLIRAGLYYARSLAYPDLNVAYYMDQVDLFVTHADQLMMGGLTTAERAQALSHYLFTVEDFRGNRQAYGDPRNSFLNELLERRLGIPITLSVLYITIAQRLNIPAYGVGLPGHFVVGVDLPEQGSFPLLIDPFDEGKIVTEEKCKQLIMRSTGWSGEIRPEWLAPQSNRLILTRMLNNLRFGYIRTEHWQHGIVVIEHMRLVQPDLVELKRDEGLLRLQKREYYTAALLLQAYLQENPAAPDRDTIRQNLTKALQEWGRLN